MARAACKIIINDGIRGMAVSLERIAMSPLVRDVMLTAAECDEVIQQLADIDLAIYHGGTVPHGGYRGIMKELMAKGVFTSEVWEVFA